MLVYAATASAPRTERGMLRQDGEVGEAGTQVVDQRQRRGGNVPCTFVGRNPRSPASGSSRCTRPTISKSLGSTITERGMRLDRDDEEFRRDEDVDRDDIERGRAVDQQVVDIERGQSLRRQLAGEGALPFEGIEELQLGGGEVRVAGHDGEPGIVVGMHDIRDLDASSTRRS